jgi:hypothetical protein
MGGARYTVTQVFRKAIMSDMATFVGTLAHEWAHQSGLSETWAKAIGDDAATQYKKDNGAKCNN